MFPKSSNFERQKKSYQKINQNVRTFTYFDDDNDDESEESYYKLNYVFLQSFQFTRL